jgi:hypothetical protein
MTVGDDTYQPKDGKIFVFLEVDVTALRFPNQDVPGAVVQRAVLDCSHIALKTGTGSLIKPALLHVTGKTGKWERGGRGLSFGDTDHISFLFYRPTETVRFVATAEGRITDLAKSKLHVFGQPIDVHPEIVR